MDLKGEVSQKIKSAIKAKLVEIGQNVDDELPDYIMVMIANKRTKAQMDTDLSLFLGSQTDRFTTWLHQVLNRLKEVTLGSATKAEASPEKPAKAKKRPSDGVEGESSSKKSKRTAEEKKKLKDEKRKKKEEKGVKEKSKKDKGDKDDSKKRKHREKEKKKSDKPEKSDKHEKSDSGKEKSDKEEKVKSNKPETVTPQNVKEAKLEEVKGLEEKLIQQRVEGVSTGDSKKPRRESVTSKVETEAVDVKPKEVEELPDYESEPEEDVLQIGLDDKIEVPEPVEECDKASSKPAREVIRGPSPSRDQPVRRVIRLKRSPSPQERKRMSPPILKNEKPATKSTATVRPSVMSRLGSVVIPVQRSVRRSVSPDQSEEKKRMPSSIVKIKARPKLAPVNLGGKSLILKAVVDATKSVVSSEKKLPVKEEEPQKQERRSVKDRLGVQVKKEHEAPKRRFESDDAEKEKVEQRQSHLRDVLKKIKRQMPVEGKETEVVVKLDGSDLSQLPKVLQDDDMEYEIEYEEEEIEVEETLEETIEEEMESSPTPAPMEVVKINERCRNWPGCKFGTDCRYVHPSKPCIVFPGCPFGSRCLHIHPKCHYDLGCTKPDCPFTHSGPRVPTPALANAPMVRPALPISGAVPPYQSSLVRPKTLPACKYFPNCMNPSCPFFHPKICRFGIACTRPDCSFTHPTSVKPQFPSMSQNQKWIAPNLK